VHPILENRQRLAIYLMAWMPIGAIFTVILKRGMTSSWPEAILVAVPMALLYAFMCLSAWYVCLAAPMPQYATLLVIFALSSLGLPGTNSFVGEFLVLVGTFLWSKVATAFASLGIILAATYLLWMIQRVVFGVPSPHHLPNLRDLSQRELATLVPLVLLVFLIGLFPNPFVSRMHQSVTNTIASMSRAKVAPTAHPSAGGAVSLLADSGDQLKTQGPSR
jgi:NADH:ubiquinone oxidoreductase subunit 4 (subunit M)